MTNYNERLDEILDWQTRLLVREAVTQNVADTKKLHITNEMLAQAKSEAKVDLTSLIKELVAEAMPEPSTNLTSYEAQMFIASTEEYRQNLLKALEEK